MQTSLATSFIWHNVAVQISYFLLCEKQTQATVHTSCVCSSVNAGCSRVTLVCLCNASYASE